MKDVIKKMQKTNQTVTLDLENKNIESEEAKVLADALKLTLIIELKQKHEGVK